MFEQHPRAGDRDHSGVKTPEDSRRRLPLAGRRIKEREWGERARSASRLRCGARIVLRDWVHPIGKRLATSMPIAATARPAFLRSCGGRGAALSPHVAAGAPDPIDAVSNGVASSQQNREGFHGFMNARLTCAHGADALPAQPRLRLSNPIPAASIRSASTSATPTSTPAGPPTRGMDGAITSPEGRLPAGARRGDQVEHRSGS